MASLASNFSRLISFLTLCGTSGIKYARKPTTAKTKCCEKRNKMGEVQTAEPHYTEISYKDRDGVISSRMIR
jgi:hypothetical protein